MDILGNPTSDPGQDLSPDATPTFDDVSTSQYPSINDAITSKYDKTGGPLSGTIDMDGNTIINLPQPVLTTEPATKEYVDNNRSTISQTEIIVNPSTGDDGTGLRGDITKPFLTLKGAYDASLDGDKIICHNGNLGSTAFTITKGVDISVYGTTANKAQLATVSNVSFNYSAATPSIGVRISGIYFTGTTNFIGSNMSGTTRINQCSFDTVTFGAGSYSGGHYFTDCFFNGVFTLNNAFTIFSECSASSAHSFAVVSGTLLVENWNSTMGGVVHTGGVVDLNSVQSFTPVNVNYAIDSNVTTGVPLTQGIVLRNCALLDGATNIKFRIQGTTNIFLSIHTLNALEANIETTGTFTEVALPSYTNGTLIMGNKQVKSVADATDTKDAVNKSQLDTKLTDPSLTLSIPKFDNVGAFVASDLKIEEGKTGDVYVLENANPEFRLENSAGGNAAIRFTAFGVGETASIRYDNSLSEFEISSLGASLTLDANTITSNKTLAIEDTIPKLTIKNTAGASGTIQFLDQNDVETARIFSEKTIGSVIYLLPDSNLSNKGLAINQEGSIFPFAPGLNELGVTSSRWEIMYGKDINLEKATPTIVMKNTTPTLTAAKIEFQDSTGTDKAAVEFVDDQNLFLRADTNVALNAGSSFIQMEPAGHLSPDVPNTQDLGKSTNRWRTLYVDSINDISPYGGIFTQINTVNFTASTTPDSQSMLGSIIGTITAPANATSLGNTAMLKVGGILTAGNNHTIRFKLLSNAAVIVDTGDIVLANVSGEPYEMEVEFTVRAIGGPGVADVVANGQITYSDGGVYKGLNFNSSNNTTYDTTVITTFDIEATLSDAGDSVSTTSVVLSRLF
jgi:hypothetical protein